MGEQVTEFIKWAAKKKAENPTLQDDIADLVQLCIDEIDGGGSTSNEISLAMNSIEELIEDNS